MSWSHHLTVDCAAHLRQRRRCARAMEWRDGLTSMALIIQLSAAYLGTTYGYLWTT